MLISAAALIRGAYSCKYGANRYYYGIKHSSQISAAFLEEKVTKRRDANSRKFGTFPYALWNLKFTNKFLVNDKVTVFA